MKNCRNIYWITFGSTKDDSSSAVNSVVQADVEGVGGIDFDSTLSIETVGENKFNVLGSSALSGYNNIAGFTFNILSFKRDRGRYKLKNLAFYK